MTLVTPITLEEKRIDLKPRQNFFFLYICKTIVHRTLMLTKAREIKNTKNNLVLHFLNLIDSL